MTINVKIATEASERWLARIDARSKREAALKTGRVTEMETPERIEKRLRRLTAMAIGAQMPRPVSGAADRGPSLVERVGLERVIGKSDFLGINFLELALAVSRFVGRIHIRTSRGRTAAGSAG